MHSIEQKHQFTLLRSQGWSLAKIAAHINVPKATIWRWDHEDTETLQVLKAVRFEELQEKFVPTYEEELQQLTAYRDRIRKALASHDFTSMKPEFLLQMDLQISARLAKFRANLALHSLPDTEPVSLPGCVSRTELKYSGMDPEDDSAVAEPTGEGDSPTIRTETAESGSPSTLNSQPSTSSRNGTFRDETPPGSKRDASLSATYNEKNGTVPFSRNGKHTPPEATTETADDTETSVAAVQH